MNNTIKDILNEGILQLKKNNVEEYVLKAKILLGFILGKSKEYLISHDDKILDKEIIVKYKENICKISEGIPIQYVIGSKEFMGLQFEVSPDVLIPQPDTEVLVEETLNIIKTRDKVLDMCTGSGAIAISLAKYKDGVSVVGADISAKALEIARKNARQK